MKETVLTIEHLTKEYDGQTVLNDISLDVHEGEVIVIVGPSGSGKSTLLRCINALEDIQGGEIRLRGQKIVAGAKDLPQIRQKIGMVFQSYELFPHLHPEILLFDEVTAALDPEMVREVLEVILQLAENKRTMLIVTHEMQFARAVADRILLLDDGRIQEDTDPETFFENPKTELAKRFLQSFEYTRTAKSDN